MSAAWMGLQGSLPAAANGWVLAAAAFRWPSMLLRSRAVATSAMQRWGWDAANALTHPQPFGTSFTSPPLHKHLFSTTSSTASADIPHTGPLRERLRALPFTVTPAAAQSAFTAYHLQQHPASSGSTTTAIAQRRPWLSWLYSRQQPALRRPLKEAFLPFWVGQASVEVAVRSAEVGTRHLVSRYNKRTGRYEPDWETKWTRVRTDLLWHQQHKPEDTAMQLYAAYKYNRSDMEALRPGPAVSAATRITPDLLHASPGSASDTRRVGPFVIPPDVARKQLAATIRAAAHKEAEQRLLQLTGAQLVRLVDLEVKYLSGGSGPLLSPLYVPAYIFSWLYGGTKVRTFVSGVNAAAVSGVQVLNDQAVAVAAAGLTTTALGLTGLASGPALFWGGMVVPFLLGGLAARFWPLLRKGLENAGSWWEQQRHGSRAAGAAAGDGDEDATVWDRDYVRAFQAHHTYERQQQQSYSGQQTFRGFTPQDFEDLIRDPFSWFEKQFARQQQRQQQQQFQQRTTGRQQQQQQQRQWTAGSSQPAAGPVGDPLGYYQRLGVQPSATPQEVQAAFRGLALKHHPDRYSEPGAKAEATKRFQGITEAYQVLRDASKRQQYDAGMYRA